MMTATLYTQMQSSWLKVVLIITWYVMSLNQGKLPAGLLQSPSTSQLFVLSHDDYQLGRG